MKLSKDPMFLRSIIMDNYEHPNKKTSEPPQDYVTLQNKSSTCIDDITVHIKVENNVIKDIVFSGIGCAVSTSSTNIMANLLINLPVKQAYNIIEQYYQMVNNQPYDEDVLQELIAFHKIHEQSNRIKCALIGINAIHNCLKEIVDDNELSS